jgi:hypothetical protein
MAGLMNLGLASASLIPEPLLYELEEFRDLFITSRGFHSGGDCPYLWLRCGDFDKLELTATRFCASRE